MVFYMDDVVEVVARGLKTRWRVTNAQDCNGCEDTDQQSETEHLSLVPVDSKARRRRDTFNLTMDARGDRLWRAPFGGDQLQEDDVVEVFLVRGYGAEAVVLVPRT
jgi:hypothetical protein